jgi:hypothetical protein
VGPAGAAGDVDQRLKSIKEAMPATLLARR